MHTEKDAVGKESQKIKDRGRINNLFEIANEFLVAFPDPIDWNGVEEGEHGKIGARYRICILDDSIQYPDPQRNDNARGQSPQIDSDLEPDDEGNLIFHWYARTLPKRIACS